MTKLNDEVGIFYLSVYGYKLALGFEGIQDFIERSYNLFYNYGGTNGKLYKIHDTFSYIVISDQEKIKKALSGYFYGELSSQFKTETYDEELGTQIIYDEEKLEAAANEEARKFINNKILIKNFALFKDFRDEFATHISKR